MADPATNQDAFDLLGIEPRFDLDAGEVQRAWLTRAAQSHPDLAPAGGSADPAQLNQARAELADPERRANLLLARRGGPGPEDRSLPDGFLEQMFEVRARMEQDLAEGGGVARERLEAWANERRDEYIARVGALFALGDEASLREIRTQLNAWRYIERMIEQLDPEYSAGIGD